MFFSKLDEKYLDESDPDEWVLFVKQIDDLQYTLSFPRQPKSILNEKSGQISYQVDFKDDFYLWKISKVSKEVDRNSFVKYILENEWQEPFTSFQETHTLYGPTLDVQYVDPDDESSNYQMRVILFEEKGLFLTFFARGSSDHRSFFQSFEIVAPLGK